MTIFTVVRADVAPEAGAREDEFVRWWAEEHQREYVAEPGFRRCWLLRRLDHPGAVGARPQRYSAVYEVDGVDEFNRVLDAAPPWGPWQRYVDTWLLNWERTYRTLLSTRARDGAQGAHWAIVTADVDLPTERDERDFHTWYEERHVPELLANPGFHRAVRLRLAPHDRDLGSRGHRFWAVYEVDDPDDFAGALRRRREAGQVAWEHWADAVTDWSVSLHRVVNRIDADPADGAGRTDEGARA